jgi:hypothetical protein
VNFTRDPIIETVISPKEGFKLVVRNSKISSHEEFSVDAVEVVSFSGSLFYRSLERPQSFLLPVADYEVLEERETRVVLKNASFEKNIKIAGGRAPKEEKIDEEAPMESVEARHQHPGHDRKRGRHRNRRRGRHHEDRMGAPRHQQEAALPSGQEDFSSIIEPESNGEAKIPTFTGLIPPPPTLISESLARYKKEALEQTREEAGFDEPTFPSKEEGATRELPEQDTEDLG